ncbi:hypothetical protein [Microbacterium lacus]|uniref:hypothetical protein n=1 Tax=Microbacterium lacus TaxID=415217 RepID=UPI000C2C6405|nr:hypothetical protein [Microbacterium lacus]
MTSSVEELIERQREMNTPPPPKTDGPPPPDPNRFKRLIEKAREYVENRWESLDVVLADEVLKVDIGRISGKVWCDLESTHPPKVQADVELGYDRLELPRAYPVERLKLNGEPTTVETWQDVYDLLEAEDRTNVAAVVWGINVGEPEENHARLARLHGQVEEKLEEQLEQVQATGVEAQGPTSVTSDQTNEPAAPYASWHGSPLNSESRSEPDTEARRETGGPDAA